MNVEAGLVEPEYKGVMKDFAKPMNVDAILAEAANLKISPDMLMLGYWHLQQLFVMIDENLQTVPEVIEALYASVFVGLIHLGPITDAIPCSGEDQSTKDSQVAALSDCCGKVGIALMAWQDVRLAKASENAVE